MSKSQAIVFPAERKAEMQSYEVPELKAGEVLVRTEYSGVSQGTEIWAYVGKRVELKFPTVPGYQAVGTIEALGPDVTGYKVGQRVLFTSSRLPKEFPDTWMAAHVSHAVVAVRDGFPMLLPDGVDPVAAALAALPAVSLRGIRMIDVAIGDLVVVNGQGMIGQASAQFAKLRGGIVITTDLSAKRRELSQQYSADIVVNPKETKLADVVHSIKPKGADVVIETTGRSDQFAVGIDLLRWEGSMLLQGYYPDPITFDFWTTHGKKPKIAVTCGQGAAEAAVVLQLLKYKKLHIGQLATHVLPVADAPGLYPKMAASDPNILGVVFDWRKA